MAPLRISNLFLLFQSSITIAVATEPVFNNKSQASLTATNATNTSLVTLLPPIYHNASFGQTWVFASSPYDLGARSMTCECFSPEYECCMPQTGNLEPYCMPVNSTCCGNTFCVQGETCCGDFCCYENTTCNLKLSGSGCCPVGAICSGLAICYDYASSNCSNTLSPKPQCCPADLPYCRDFNLTGLGCYASSNSKAASTMGSVTTISNPFATGLETEPIKTVTMSLLTNSGHLSLAFPSFAASATVNESIDFVLEWPTVSVAATTKLSTASTSSFISTTTAASHPTTPTTTRLSSSTSALCFNQDLQSPAPCSSTTAPTINAATAVYSPPGASILVSQATRLNTMNYFLPWLEWAKEHIEARITITHLTLITLSALLILTFQFLRPSRQQSEGLNHATELDPAANPALRQEIHMLPDSGRVLTPASPLGREIKPLRARERGFRIGLDDVSEPAGEDGGAGSLVEIGGLVKKERSRKKGKRNGKGRARRERVRDSEDEEFSVGE